MAVFLVGPNDGSFFKRRSTWDFDQALQAANDGDTIELVEDFCPYYENNLNSNTIKITKSITIVGHIRKSENILTNVLNPIFVSKGANVTLKNICIRVNKEKSNCLNIKEESHLNAENILIENECESGVLYPIVYISGNSKVNFVNSTVRSNTNLDGNNVLFSQQSIVTASNCIFSTGISGDSTDFHIEDSIITNNNANALFMKNQSTIHLDSVEIRGGKKTEKTTWPCVKIIDSNGQFNQVIIQQDNYHSSLSLHNTSISIDHSRIDSLFSSNSKVYIKYIQIVESFTVKEKSMIESKSIDILGKENGKINLFASTNSSIYADTINFGKVSNPNIKLEHNVNFKVNQIRFLSFDESQFDFKRDIDGNAIVLEKDVHIEYFGEKSASQRLNELIGIQSVKEEVEAFIAVAQMNMLRKQKGLKSSELTLHSLFLGNPGTGKTTVARLIGEMLYEKNVISKQIFIEVSRSDLVANYIGQTAIKTRNILESALGGVLFIDEAYTLASGGEKDFGIEAINEILTFMENHRNDIVIIFAGYTNDMNKFLNTNAGLKSRIPNIFDFPDYTIDELIHIGLIDIYKESYTINEKTYRELVYNNYDKSYDYSNGRWIRNLNDQIIKRMAIRIIKTNNPDTTCILDEDLYSLII